MVQRKKLISFQAEKKCSINLSNYLPVLWTITVFRLAAELKLLKEKINYIQTILFAYLFASIETLWLFLDWQRPKMECYATHWRLWRESRNLWIFTEPSYPKKAPLSL